MSTVQVTEDQTYVFGNADFGSGYYAVSISSLPTTGTLELNGVQVKVGKVVYASQIAAGNLVFVPNTDVSAAGSFNFKALNTNGGTIFSGNMALGVTPDAGPTASASSISATENRTYIFQTSDFGYSDTADKTSDPFGGVTITSAPSDGTIELNGMAVTLGQSITASQISSGQLTFVPNANSTASGSFSFKVTDGLGGTTSASAALMSIGITAVTNLDPGPTTQSTTLQGGTENQPFTAFTAASFPFTDSFNADQLRSITIYQTPTAGTLQLNGQNVTAGQVIPVGSIPSLGLVPNNDATSVSFKFQVTDQNGGVSSTPATMTVDFAANSGASSTGGSVTTAENQNYVFKTSDFGYSDSGEPNDSLASIIITSASLPSDGTIIWNGTALTGTGTWTIPAGDISSNKLVYQPKANVTTTPGAPDTFSFQVTDAAVGGTSSTSATAVMSIGIDPGPTTQSNTLQGTENQAFAAFTAASFPFTDTFDADQLKSITVYTLPTTGTLKLGSNNVTAGQVIPVASIPSLSLVPNNDVMAGSFQFEVTDQTGGITSGPATMTVNFAANGGASSSGGSVTTAENQTYVFKSGDFGYSDLGESTDPMGSVIITSASLPSDGTIIWNGTALTGTGTWTIPAGDISSNKLVYQPKANVTTAANAPDIFNFQVTDAAVGGTVSTSTAAVMDINISSDPGPTTSGGTVTVTEDGTYPFKTTDFGYSDSFDPSDLMAKVTITSLPTTGALKWNGTALSGNGPWMIPATDISNGKLVFVPNTDVTQQGSFSFAVTDTTGGVTSSAATMTLKVAADAGPSALASAVTATENQTYTFKVSDFGYSDAADVSADPPGSITITSLPSDGALKLSGVAVTSGQTVLASDISAGHLTFVPNTNSTASGSFNFKVTDSLGGTTSASAAAMSINIAVPGATPSPQLSFAAQNFNTVGADNSGFYMIPPDPNAAVGLNTVITATNGVIETFNKSGVLQTNTSLNNFFVAGLGSLVLTNFNDPNQSGPFDPKVTYDPYTNRFIVVALQQSNAGGTFNDTNTSNILIAVSSPDTGGALTWKYTSINSDVIANGTNCSADYPGLSVDGSGNLYVTTNLFDHASGNYQGSRLWTISENDILSGAAGTNATASGKASIYDPSVASGATSAGSSELFTLMPAQMLPGTGAFAKPSGTYLVSYNGASNSQGQVLNVIQVTPQSSGGPTFAYQQINLGNIDSAGAFASFTAPQKGTTRLIDADDDRVYSAVFRNGVLYAATTIIPTSSYDSANAGKTTAHWFQINASTSNLSLMQQGDVNGAGIASGLRTYYPSISVDANGDFAIGFSASGPNNYASAYYEAYKYNASSSTWTFDTPTLLAGGVASYYRTFGSGDNRWGDFSSVVPDPSSPSTFWVYNEYAMSQGTTISRESGRWATQVGEFTLPNTATGPVVAGGSGTGSIQPTGSGSPSTATPGSAQFAQSDHHGHRQTSDINASANPLVESDHGPSIAFLPSDGHHLDGFSSQIAGSFSQLVQTMAAFGTNHEGIPALSGTVPNDPVSPNVLAANLFHHHG